MMIKNGENASPAKHIDLLLELFGEVHDGVAVVRVGGFLRIFPTSEVAQRGEPLGGSAPLSAISIAAAKVAVPGSHGSGALHPRRGNELCRAHRAAPAGPWLLRDRLVVWIVAELRADLLEKRRITRRIHISAPRPAAEIRAKIAFFRKHAQDYRRPHARFGQGFFRVHIAEG